MAKRKQINPEEAINEVKTNTDEFHVTSHLYTKPDNNNLNLDELIMSPEDIFRRNIAAIEYIDTMKNIITASGESMGGTINTLTKSYNKIADIFGRYEKDNLDKRLAPIEEELITVRTAITQYEEQKNNLEKISAFIKDNSAFFISSIESQGKIHIIETEISSISKRLEKVETNKNINWNRTTTLVSIFIAILSVIGALYVAFK